MGEELQNGMKRVRVASSLTTLRGRRIVEEHAASRIRGPVVGLQQQSRVRRQGDTKRSVPTKLKLLDTMNRL